MASLIQAGEAIPPFISVIYNSPLATHVRESEITFPLLQTFHVLGILLMVGSIAIVDLRILGVVLKERTAAEVGKSLLPVTWVGFIVMFLSGGSLFAAQSGKIYDNIFLQVKLGLLLFAALNVVIFHAPTYRSIASWPVEGAPRSAKAAAVLSLVVWAAVVVTGRYIAYY